jgi:hypothetical protein
MALTLHCPITLALSSRSAPAEEEADRQDRKRKASGDAADGGSAAGLAQRDNEEQEAAGRWRVEGGMGAHPLGYMQAWQ